MRLVSVADNSISVEGCGGVSRGAMARKHVKRMDPALIEEHGHH